MDAEGNTQLPGQAGIQFAGSDDARLVFSGPPQRLTGIIPLINTGPDKQKLRSLAVDAGVLQGAAQIPLQEFPFSAKLYPGEQAAVPGTIALDPRTPPGSYDIQVTLGDKSLPATVYVTEVVDLQMEPTEVTILAGSAQSYTRKFIAQNLGNTDLPTGARCEAPVFDSFDLVSSLLTGLHKANKSSASEMVKGFLKEWSNLQAGTLVVTRAPMILRPGQKVVVDVEFHLPPELKPFRHYRANLQLYNATLSVDIYTTAKAGSTARPKGTIDKEAQNE
ncbi:MAG: hypothetical protein V7641_5094 [Blastocatellia bacterium]